VSQHTGPLLVRSTILHTPRNPFREAGALESFPDGALLLGGRIILEAGDYATVRAAHPDVPVHDLRGGFVLPGFIERTFTSNCASSAGSDGLLDWLNRYALPEEVRMGSPTTPAPSPASLWTRWRVTEPPRPWSSARISTTPRRACSRPPPLRESASQAGLVLPTACSPSRYATPPSAPTRSRALIERFHGHDCLRYTVTRASPSRRRKPCSRSARR
jgi:guanine deaminase